MRLGRVQDLFQPLVLHEVGHQQAQAFVVGGLGSDQLEHGLRPDPGQSRQEETVVSTKDSPSGGRRPVLRDAVRLGGTLNSN